MARSEDDTKPSKVQKPRKAPKAIAPKAANRSQEFVVDSDDEEAAPEDRGVKKVNSGLPSAQKQSTPEAAEGKALPFAGAAESEEEDEDDEEDEEDEEDDEGGEDEDDEAADEVDTKMGEAGTLKKPDKVPAKVNGVKRSAEESGSSEEESEVEGDEESDEEKLPSPPPAKKSKMARTPAEAGIQGDNSEEATASSKSGAQPKEALTSIPAQPFKAPAGYTAVELSLIHI